MEEKNCFDKKVSALKTQKKALFVKIKFNLLNWIKFKNLFVSFTNAGEWDWPRGKLNWNIILQRFRDAKNIVHSIDQPKYATNPVWPEKIAKCL